MGFTTYLSTCSPINAAVYYLGNAANVSPDIQWATSLQHPYSIIFQTAVCLLSQHFNISMVACHHCWLIFGPTILVHNILLFLQQLSLSFTPALVLEYLGFHVDSKQG